MTHHSLLPQAEKNRLAAMANNLQKGSGVPMRLYVGSLHCNITEDMLRGIFEPFGKVSRKRGKPLKGIGKSGEGECSSSFCLTMINPQHT